MKYDKKAIMTRAWWLYNHRHCKDHTFGQCLAYAWREAKVKAQTAADEAAYAAERAAIYAGIIEQMRKLEDFELDHETYTWQRWTKYDKDRMYIKRIATRGKVDVGYVDLVTRQNYSQLPDELAALIAAEYPAKV